MKKSILIFISFLLSFGSFAQSEWLCVYLNKKVYFENESKLVYCIRIDSTYINGMDTILYPFSDLHKIAENCYSVKSGSWISKYIIIDENGNTTFVNGKNQQIFIKSQAVLNEVWDVFENDNIKVKGKITSIEKKNVLGVEDSVKTITFLVYDLSETPINYDLNQISIEVSKHFGLVKTVNFYYFEHTTNNYYNNFGEFNLIGINEPQLGFKNILKEDCYDFQIGDELHIRYISGGYYSFFNQNRIIRYISRTDYNDSIIYYYEYKTYTKHKSVINDTLTTSISMSQDTLKQKINKGELLFETESNEPYGNDDVYKIIINNIQQTTIYVANYFLYYYEDCLMETIFDGCSEAPTYYLGLGGPYYADCEMWGNRYCQDLVYYKKGNTEWGTPFDFEISIAEYENNNSFYVYPNPTNDKISIKSTNNETLNNATLEIYDIQGRKCFNKNIDSSTFIDISFLDTGYYIVKLIKNNQNIKIERLIKL